MRFFSRERTESRTGFKDFISWDYDMKTTALADIIQQNLGILYIQEKWESRDARNL